MKNIMKFSLLVAASIFANACADGESSETLMQKQPNNTNQPQNTTTCTAGDQKCSESGMYSYICDNNDWLPLESCTNGCLSGKCIKSQTDPTPSECVNNTRMCSDDGKKIFKCSNGSWALADVCDYGCKDGVCNATQPQQKCNKDAKKCSEDGLKTYICKDGDWAVNENCANGCKSGDCISAVVTTCTNGERKCASDNSRVLLCSGNSWQDSDTCTNGCNNGQCLPVNSCTNGSRKCADDNSHTIVCSGNIWQDGDICENGCKSGQCLPKTPTPDCTNGSRKCAEDNSHTIVCTSDTWQYGEACSDGCRNGVCNEPPTCTDNDKKCAEDGSRVLLCSGGSWTPSTPCTNGCDAGQCIPDDPGFTCAEGYEPCNSSCLYSTELTCTEYCAAEGSSVCCMQDKKFMCSTGEVIPDGVPYYCGSYTLTTEDDTEMTIAEYCGSKVGICVNRDGSPKFTCDVACTASQVGRTNPLCEELLISDLPKDVAYNEVCTKIADGIYTYRMDVESAVICKYGCDSSGIACVSSSAFTCTGDFEPCDSSCYVGSNIPCMQNCESKGSSICCMDDSFAYCFDKGAEEPPSFTCTGAYEPCDSTCYVDDTLCMEYCESNGKDICCMDDTRMYCYDKGAEE